jgi:hypothetical protein
VQAPGSQRRFAVVEIYQGATAVDDLDENRRLGELRGDLTSVPVRIGDVMHVIFAGQRFDALRTEQVVIEQPPNVPEVCRVRNGVWISNPRPLVAGMRISASFREADGSEWWRYDSPPLPPDGTLPPVHGPGWVHWGPHG